MPSSDEVEGLRIGEVLKRTRTRAELDVRTVEERTKIRTKYLRALENEEWDVLPGPAYAKGFLRTYAQCLGLDGDALVDEYRRTVESSLGAGAPHLLAEPVLERRIRPGEEPRSRWPSHLSVIAGLGAVAVAVLLVLGLTGGSGHKGRQGHHKGNAHGHAHGGRNPGTGGGASVPVTLSLVPRGDMEICLVPGHGRPLIDSQTLIAGARQGPFPAAKHYRLDLDNGGTAIVRLSGKPQRVQSKGPASFAIDSSGVHPIGFQGPNCP